jgi:hypothetical protein
MIKSATDRISRLSWMSIDSFDQNRSTMEELVHDIGRQHTQKTRILSAIISLGILLFFCYVVNIFFITDRATTTSHNDIYPGGNNPMSSSTSSNIEDEYNPKILIPDVISSLLHHHRHHHRHLRA